MHLAAQGVQLAAQGVHLGVQGFHLAAQGCHLGAQGVAPGLRLDAQGLCLTAQVLYIVHMGQMLHLVRYWLSRWAPRISRANVFLARLTRLTPTSNNNLPT